MLWQLCCDDMCKTVARSDNYFWCKSKRWFWEIGIMSSKTIYKINPWPERLNCKALKQKGIVLTDLSEIILCKRPANERWRYNCNVVFPWLSACTEGSLIYHHCWLYRVQTIYKLTSNTLTSNEWTVAVLYTYTLRRITPTPYMILPLFATRFAAYAGGIRVSFIQPRLF